jgi:hypothetical protein
MVPVVEKIAAPTDYASVKAAVQPVLDRLMKQIPEAQRQASPGFSILKQIMDRPAQVGLDTALADLSAINSIGYNDIPAMRNVAQGVAAYAGKALRAAVDESAANLGPEAVSALKALRDTTVQKKTLAQTLKGLVNSNPVSLVNRLAAGEDAGIKLLGTVAKEAPDSIPDIARSTLEKILNNSTSKGGFKNVESTAKMWEKLGPQAKQILFGDKVGELDDFFSLGRMVGENPNPSGTASVAGIAHTAGTLATHPLLGLASIVGAKTIANFLTSPNGPAIIRQGLTLDLGTPMGKAAAISMFKSEPPAKLPKGENEAAPATEHKEGDTVTLKDVGPVTIKKINSDGSFEY